MALLSDLLFKMPKEPEERLFWYCTGTELYQFLPRYFRRQITSKLWIVLHSNPQQATKLASMSNSRWWKWDGKPPSATRIPDAFKEAKAKELAGVRVKEYVEGKWISTLIYPNRP